MLCNLHVGQQWDTSGWEECGQSDGKYGQHKNGQEVCQEGWLFLEIERQRLVITVTDISIYIIFWQGQSLHLDVGSSHNHVLELIVFPSIECSIITKAALSWKPHSDTNHHVKWHGTHKLVVFDVQEHELQPEMCWLGSFDDLHNVR